MKISASIYSDKKRELKETIQDLVNHNVDLLHVDCNDDLTVFEDIKQIRTWCNIPIDLHIITDTPSKYMPYLEETPVEYVTFQYENLKEQLNIPKTITAKKGLAIITPTSIDAFDNYADFDFILIMATIPGQSGGVFDRYNFEKIRAFKNKYPAKSIHVDGGVNGEVSFILRNMGVSSSVSGSYLFNAPSVGQALMNLTNRSVESEFLIEDFMIPLNECPNVRIESLNLKSVLTAIEKGKLGFTLISNASDKLVGIISNADIRKGLLNQFDRLPEIDVMSMMNENPVKIKNINTVVEMLNLIKKCPFPVMYLPVVDNEGNAKGIVTFVNLVKSEI
jgi:pentose-5-phosphate-3-epimerase